MKKLSLPAFTADKTYLTCAGAVTTNVYRVRLENCSEKINSEATVYVEKAKIGKLYSLPYIPSKKKHDPVVICNLKKSELMDIYTTYMVKRVLPRKIYDSILVSANDRCPFCGGIGRPKTLDHYLPKANYPVFSVHPANLVPSCRDCNTGKGNAIILEAGKQVLHPYFDDDCYFNEKWVSARVIITEPLALEFYVDPPALWNQVSKDRVSAHFADFDLAKRYSIQAADEVSILVDQRKNLMRDFTSDQFRDYILSLYSGTLFINLWKRVMYYALSEDKIFCSKVF